MNDILKMIGVAALLIPASGCAALSWLQHDQPNLVLADAEHPIERIICIWQPAEGHGLDGLPCRGFAGQIFFFTRGVPTPVVANGEVQIFVFDDQGTPEEQTKPLHEFEFTQEAWTRLLQETQLGPAYSLFVPYTRQGQHEAHCALLVRLKPIDGPPVTSDMAYVTLPGRKPPLELNEKASNPNDLRDGETDRRSATRTTTIRPPLPLASQLAKSATERRSDTPKKLSHAAAARPISSTRAAGRSRGRQTVSAPALPKSPASSPRPDANAARMSNSKGSHVEASGLASTTDEAGSDSPVASEAEDQPPVKYFRLTPPVRE
ncbi:MAG: hypothetical protein GXP27_04350 [Planctomycetes bacterium]|nr:hypothetical protein [Planctomycetota bacterium]